MSNKHNLSYASVDSSRLHLNHQYGTQTPLTTDGLVELYITADGAGISGYYDRIHAVYENGRHSIFPAHHCEEWDLRNESI